MIECSNKQSKGNGIATMIMQPAQPNINRENPWTNIAILCKL